MLENPFSYSCLDGTELVAGERVQVVSKAPGTRLFTFHGEFGYVIERGVIKFRVPILAVRLVDADQAIYCYPYELVHSAWEEVCFG